MSCVSCTLKISLNRIWKDKKWYKAEMVSIYTYSKGTVGQTVGAHSCNIRLWKFSSCLGHKLWRGKNIRLPLLQKFLRERCLLCHPVSVAPVSGHWRPGLPLRHVDAYNASKTRLKRGKLQLNANACHLRKATYDKVYGHLVTSSDDRTE